MAIRCPDCKVFKERSEFYNVRASRNGRSGYCKACMKKRAMANPNRLIRKREYYQRHKEYCLQKANEWKKKNPEARKAIQARWYRNNAAAVNMMNRKRLNVRTEATPKWAIEFFMDEAYALARLRTKMLGQKWVVDHIVPLMHKRVCGLHSHTNMQVIPDKVNASKSNRYWPDMPEMNHGN